MVPKLGKVLQSHCDIAELRWECWWRHKIVHRWIFHCWVISLIRSLPFLSGCSSAAPDKCPVKVRVWWLILKMKKCLFYLPCPGLNLFLFIYLVSWAGVIRKLVMCILMPFLIIHEMSHIWIICRTHELKSQRHLVFVHFTVPLAVIVTFLFPPSVCNLAWKAVKKKDNVNTTVSPLKLFLYCSSSLLFTG